MQFRRDADGLSSHHYHRQLLKATVSFCLLPLEDQQGAFTLERPHKILTRKWMGLGTPLPRWFPLSFLCTAFLWARAHLPLLFCRSLFSSSLVRIPHGIHIGDSNGLCVLFHFSSCVKPPCSFVMWLPNRLDCSTEALFAKAFSYPW